MKSRIVVIPALAAIWLGLPALALSQDREPRQAQSRPREAQSRPKDAGTKDAGNRESGRAERDRGRDQNRDQGRDQNRAQPRDQNRAQPRDQNRPEDRDRDRGGRTAVARPPSFPVNSQVYRQRPQTVYRPAPGYSSNNRPRYYAPVYYDRWAYRTYRISPLRFVPWSLIYGSIGFSNFGYYSYGSSYGYPSYSGPSWYGGGYYPPYGGTTYDTGAVRLQIRPRDAEVFVDGFFAGYVDDFDGTFQSLRLEQGGHKIEVRMPGFQTFEIDVHVQPGRTLTIREDLHP